MAYAEPLFNYLREKGKIFHKLHLISGEVYNTVRSEIHQDGLRFKQIFDDVNQLDEMPKKLKFDELPAEHGVEIETTDLYWFIIDGKKVKIYRKRNMEISDEERQELTDNLTELGYKIMDFRTIDV